MKLDSAPPMHSSVTQTQCQLVVQENIDCSTETTLVPLPSTTPADKPQKLQTPLAIFATTFLTIFLAEIGDKTQLSTLLMSAESHSPWLVFLGSAAALMTTSLLGVVVGSWMANRLSPKIVEKASGIMLLLISVMLFWDLVSK